MDNGSNIIKSSGLLLLNGLNKALESWEKTGIPNLKINLTNETIKKNGIGEKVKLGDIVELNDGDNTIIYGIICGIDDNSGIKININTSIKKIISMRKIGNIYSGFNNLRTNRRIKFEDIKKMHNHEKSNGLEENDSEEEEYEHFEGYNHIGGNRDFFVDPNIGWKFHLNVKAKNIKPVEDFLKKKDYYFKLLNGGDYNDKTFTIYVGSIKKAYEISKDLEEKENWLCKPRGTTSDEVEFGPGVVGRFCSFHYNQEDFYRYGIYGMDLIKSNNQSYLTDYYRGKLSIKDERLLQQAESTFNILSSIFGSYFHG